MAEIYHRGSASLGPSEWSDAIGIAANAEAVIAPLEPVSTNITQDLNQSGSNVDYFHIRDTFNGNLGSSSASAQIDFDSTYTAKANFSHSGGGVAHIDAGSTTVNQSVVVRGSTLAPTGGTWGDIFLINSNLIVSAGTNLEASHTIFTYGRCEILIEASSGSNKIPNIVSDGGAVIETYRDVDTGGVLAITNGSSLQYNIASGNMGQVNLSNGRLVPIRGNVLTLNADSGGIDKSRAIQACDLGTTAGRITPRVTVVDRRDGEELVTINANVTEVGGGPISRDSLGGAVSAGGSGTA